MPRKAYAVAIAIALLCLALSGCVPQSEARVVKYTMYIGLSDQDTYTQLISSEEAEQRVREIALRYVDGLTVLRAAGAYKDDQGVVTQENSLVVELSSATEEQVIAIMDELLAALNQHSILLEKRLVSSKFYERSGQ